MTYNVINQTQHSDLAFIFPGQGSQQVGMLRDFAEEPWLQDTFAEASDVLGYDLWAVCQMGPEDRLNQTEVTQPALLTASIALWRAWQQFSGGEQPAFLAGHSLGEYSAVVAAGALPFSEAVTLVAKRGRWMQEAVPAGVGAMAVIVGLSEAAIESVCQVCAQGDVLSPANFNSPEQVVIAGHVVAVQRAIEYVKAQGAKLVKLLPVSVPSHCGLMYAAAEQLAEWMQTLSFSTARLPIVNNVAAKPVVLPAEIRAGLAQQLYSPVRWTAVNQALWAAGIRTVVECGPGKVLAGLAKRTCSGFQVIGLSNREAWQQALSR